MTDRHSLLTAFVLGVVLTGCDASRAGGPPAAPPPVVKAEVVTEQDGPIAAEWVGTLVGSINAQIRPRVSGHLVSQNYTEGALVKKLTGHKTRASTGATRWRNPTSGRRVKS